MSRPSRPLLATAFLLGVVAPLAADEVRVPVGAGSARVPMVEDFALRTTIGLRYWYSQSNFLHELEQIDRTDLSRLEYGDANQHTAEVYFRIDDAATNGFLKGTLGIGRSSSGYFDDEDYLLNGAKFSDTFSTLDPRTIGHFSIDAGWRFANSATAKTRAGVFGGYQYIHDSYVARGARCNPDEVGGAFCGAPGDVVVPFDTKVIRNEIYWHVMRIGIEAEVELVDRLTLSSEVAVVPFTYFENEDSHYLRTALGGLPNFEDKGNMGYGIQAEAFVNYAVTDRFSVGAGGRYWWLQTKDTVTVSAAQMPYYRGYGYSTNRLERFGLTGQASYSF